MQDRIRALVVDDDADVRSLLAGVLPIALWRPEIPLTAPRWSVLRARAHRARWRHNPFDEHVGFASTEPAPSRCRALGPARIIDFEAARESRHGGSRSRR